jgi:hypothetical protein
MNRSALIVLMLVCASFSSAQVAQQPASPANRVERPPPGVVCTTIARPALAITLKNERGQVLSTFSSFGSAAPEQPVVKRETGKIFHRRLGQYSYSVTVGRRWYKTATLRGIRVQEDDCGPVRPTPVTVRLQPVRGAPQIREFSLGPSSDEGFFVGSWPYFQRYSTFLDAPGSVSRQVIWSSSDPHVATIDQTGMLRTVCNRTPGWAVITATLKADLRISASTRVGRGGGGMVCKRGEVDR